MGNDGAQLPASRYVSESSASAIEEKIFDLERIAASLVERGHPEFRAIESEMDEIRRRFSMLRDNIRQKVAFLLWTQCSVSLSLNSVLVLINTIAIVVHILVFIDPHFHGTYSLDRKQNNCLCYC